VSTRPLIKAGRPQAIGKRRLNCSDESLQRTPRSHQTRRLRVPSSDHRSLRLSSQNGCLFFRAVSSLDAFSSYLIRT